MRASLNSLASGASSGGTWRRRCSWARLARLLGHARLPRLPCLLYRYQLLHRRALMRRGKVGISHGHLNCLMAHQVGYGSKVYARHREPRRKTMSEAIPSEILNARFGDCRLEPMLVLGERLSVDIQEYPARALERALLQNLEGSQGNGIQGNVSRLPVLVFKRVMNLRTRSTRSHIRPYCSEGRIPVCRAISNSGMCTA